jgi:DNA-binding GntR family transcriptional regulator
MSRPRPLTPRSLEADVFDAIRDMILNGDLSPGDPVVEAQLSAQFGISKTPVREALIRLKRDGLVEAAPHRTNRVATPTDDAIVQACEVRGWIEAQIAARLAADPGDRLLADLQASIEAAERALAAHDDHAYVEAVRSFSTVLVEASGNRYAIDALERLRYVLGLIANVSRRTPARRDRSIEEHRRILEAIRARDPEAAAQATYDHLTSIERDSLEALAHHLGRRRQ